MIPMLWVGCSTLGVIESNMETKKMCVSSLIIYFIKDKACTLFDCPYNKYSNKFIGFYLMLLNRKNKYQIK